MESDTESASRIVPFVNFHDRYADEKDVVLGIVDSVFSHGEFVGGPEITELEEDIAGYLSVGHAVALNSGTDALILAMKAFGIGTGDEVITPPNSFVASTAAVVQAGARPVFVDVGDDQNLDPDLIESAITPKTKAIMPVHLSGRIAGMNPIMSIAEDKGLIVIEDAAQAFGSKYDDRFAGAIGHAGCFSAHPLKNLYAAGDAGFFTTNDDEAARRVRLLRNHGLADRNTVVEFGTVSRMDALQAAFLRHRLGGLGGVIERRRHNASLYRSLLDHKDVYCPPCRDIEFNTFHTFVIQVDRRDALHEALTKAGIGTAIHYPVPIHLQPAAKSLGHALGDFPVCERQSERILSLPIHQHLSDDDIRYVAAAVNGFYDG